MVRMSLSTPQCKRCVACLRYANKDRVAGLLAIITTKDFAKTALTPGLCTPPLQYHLLAQALPHIHACLHEVARIPYTTANKHQHASYLVL